MDAFFELSWRLWPSMLISGAGVALLARGIAHQREALRARPQEMSRPIALAAGLRALLLGASLVAFGFAWHFQIVWLFWLAVIFGAEETWETSMIVSALREGERLKTARASRDAPRAGAPLRHDIR